MPIRIKINGQRATANMGKNELELMLAGGLIDGLTKTVLDAIIKEIGPEEAYVHSRETFEND